jgi:hypothetical protein
MLVGTLVLAGLLFLLQRLRVRRQVVRVPTSMFWRMAVQAAPARVLHERFRHWLAYALVLSIALLLWLAASGLQMAPGTARRTQLFYLDASAAMTAPHAFDDAAAALIADARAVPADRREVVLGDPYGTLLLARGEDIALLPARLKEVRPGLYPSAFPLWVGARTGLLKAAPLPALHYYGARAAAQDGSARLDRTMEFDVGYLAPRIQNNRGIVALGASPAASGAWDKADVLVAVSAPAGQGVDGGDLAFALDGHSFTPALTARGEGRFLLHDLPANGAALAVSLTRGDAFPADDSAGLRLPLRRRITVAMTQAVPAPVQAVVRADPAFVVGPPSAAQVVLRMQQDAATPGLPEMVLVGQQGQDAAFRFTRPSGDQGTIEDALDQAGLAQFDAASLADGLHRPIGAEMVEGPRRALSVWADVFAGRTGFARSPAMPLFVSQGLRWLAEPQPWVPYAAAGGTLVDLDRTQGLGQGTGLARRALGGSIALPQAGRETMAGLPVTVSLTDRGTTDGVRLAPPADDSIHMGPGGPPVDWPLVALLLLAAVLLAAEWVLFQRGRLP